MVTSTFHEDLKEIMDTYVHDVYCVTRNFPQEELYGVTSQFRRSSLSIILNYIEGFARSSEKTYIQFLQTSYGSLKESEYLINFSYKEKYISDNEYKKLSQKADRIGKMLYGLLKQLKKK